MNLLNLVLVCTLLSMLVFYLNDGPRISVQIMDQPQMNVVSDIISAYVWENN